MSSPPLDGKFEISWDPYEDCVTADKIKTAPIPTGNAAWRVYYAIIAACPAFRDKIAVWEGSDISYRTEGRDLFIRFDDDKLDMTQFTI